MEEKHPSIPPPLSLSSPPWVKAAAVVLVGISGGFLALAPIGPGTPPWDIFGLGLILGTGVCHVTLAAGWGALGDNKLLPRIGTSAGWVVLLFALFTVGQLNDKHGPPEEFYVIAGAFVAGLWLVAQVPFWVAAIGFGWKLRRSFEDSPRMQFGLREVLIAMGAIGVLLGVLRILISPEAIPKYFLPKEFFISVFYALAFYLGMLPAMLSLFLNSRWKLALAGSLAFVSILVVVEWRVALALGAGSGPPEFLALFVGIHLAEVIWTLLFGGVMRWGEYRLVR